MAKSQAQLLPRQPLGRGIPNRGLAILNVGHSRVRLHGRMRFVSVKSREQQGILILHRTRELLVRQRTTMLVGVPSWR